MDEMDLLDDGEQFSAESEGTSTDEELEEPVTKLDKTFFNEPYLTETDLFCKYFKAIKKNRYLLTLIDEVLKEFEPCDINPNTSSNTKNIKIRYPLPPLSGSHDKSNPGMSKKITLTKIKHRNRGLQAVSNIVPGDNLIVEKALVFSVVPNCVCVKFSVFRCHHCASVIFKFVPCEHCNVCLFCDEKCLKDAWISYHQFECYGLQRHFWRDEHSYMGFRMMIACLNRFSTTIKLASDPIADAMEKFTILHGLETHITKFGVEDLNNILHTSARSLVYLIERTNFFQSLLKAKNQVSCKPYYMYMYAGGLLVRFTCAAQVSALRIPMENPLIDIGEPADYGALFVSKNVNMINHSCEPNCVLLRNKDTIIVRAVKHIKPGDEITISYYPIVRTMKFPQRQLLCKKYFFACTCDLCLTTGIDMVFLNTYCCGTCDEGRVIYDKTSVACMDCNEEGDVQQFRLAMYFTEDLYTRFLSLKLKHPEANLVRDAERVLEAMEKLYFRYNMKLYIAYQHIYRCFWNQESHFFKGCEIALKSMLAYQEHVEPTSLPNVFVMYKTPLEAMKHPNFNVVKWTADQLHILKDFKASIQNAEKLLNLYYPPDRLTFLKDAVKILDDLLSRIVP